MIAESKLKVPGYNNFVLGRPTNQNRRYMTSLTDCLSGGTSAIQSEKETINSDVFCEPCVVIKILHMAYEIQLNCPLYS